MSMTESTVVLDSRVNISKSFTQLVPFTGSNINYFSIPADGSSYPSQILFNNVVTPGSLSNTLVSREARIVYNVTITAPLNGGNPLGLPQANPAGTVPYTTSAVVTAGFRAFPLSSIVSTASVQLNGNTSTVNLRQIVSVTQRFMPKSWLQKQGSEAPTMSDNRALLVADQAGGTQWVALAPVSNQPLSKMENSVGETRGSFLPLSYTVNGNSGIWVYEISEPLLISPFTTYDDDTYFGQINNMSIQLNYSSGDLLNDMIVSSQAYDAPTSVVISNPKLQMTYISVQPTLTRIPPSIAYNYQNVVQFSKTFPFPAGTSAASYQFSSDVIRFTTMPQMIYVVARKQVSLRAGQTAADCFLSIGSLTDASAGVSVQIGSRTGLMASMTQKSMYQLAVAAGYNSSYNDYAYGSGSILAIDPVKTLGINPAVDSLPGETKGDVNFQVTLLANNKNFVYANNTAAVAGQTLECVVIGVYSGIATVTSDLVQFSIGTLSPNEINTLINKPTSWVSSDVVEKSNSTGSGLYARGRQIQGHGME